MPAPLIGAAGSLILAALGAADRVATGSFLTEMIIDQKYDNQDLTTPGWKLELNDDDPNAKSKYRLVWSEGRPNVTGVSDRTHTIGELYNPDYVYERVERVPSYTRERAVDYGAGTTFPMEPIEIINGHVTGDPIYPNKVRPRADVSSNVRRI